MSDFAKFCPKCYAFFRDPDLLAKHVEVCGYVKKSAEKSSQESEYRRSLPAEKRRL